LFFHRALTFCDLSIRQYKRRGDCLLLANSQGFSVSYAYVGFIDLISQAYMFFWWCSTLWNGAYCGLGEGTSRRSNSNGV